MTYQHEIWCIGWKSPELGAPREHTGPCNCKPVNIARCPHCGMQGQNKCWCGEHEDSEATT